MNQAELLTMLVAVPADLRASIAATVRRSLSVIAVPPYRRLSVWAEDHFYLSKESSYVEQGWTCWPFQRGWMDMMGHPDVPKFTARKSARVGYTKCLLAHTTWEHQHRRRNAVIYQPTDDDRDEFVTTELEPVLRDVRCMRSVMPRFNRRSKDNTLRKKTFSTGVLHLRGGKAAKNYRRLTVDTVKYDEFSGFDRDIEKEGNPGVLGDKRLEGAVEPKSIAGSTPKLRYNDNTEDREADADAHLRWHIPCPHCDELHPITWGGRDAKHGIKWFNDDPSTACHLCPHCGGYITQAMYLQVWEAGVWIDTATGAWLDSGRIPPDAEAAMRTAASLDWRICPMPGTGDAATLAPMPKHVAMPIWTACAPQATWQSIVEDFIAASRLAERGDTSLLKTFVNTTLGETWEEKGESSDEHALQERAKNSATPYTRCTVPIGGLYLTAGIDVQGNRWEIGVWAWGIGLESWAVEHHVIEGNPADDRDWEPVEAYLQRRFTQLWHGQSLGLDCISIDSGHHTQAVYNFVRRMQAKGLRIQAVKGASEPGRPIKGTASSQDVNFRGQVWKNGIKLWVIGSDSAKDLIHGQLQIQEPGRGHVHFPTDLPREWFEQLTAEQRVLTRTSGGVMERWIKRRPRNEVLDCRVYALHAAYMLGLHTMAEVRWDARRQAVEPPHDLFSAGATAPAQRQASTASAQPTPTSTPADAAASVPTAVIVAQQRPVSRATPRRW